ncbi:MAG: MJ0042-type zinc finger domain-containing protein [Rhodospirillales bacterium]|jgi:predicted Zn finger-like uncharacterized protein
MIISCPACSTKFVVDAKKLGSDGRRVRCGNCGHMWHQTIPPSQMAQLSQPDVVLDPPPDRIRPIPPGSGLPVPVRRPRSNAPLIAAGTFAGVLGVMVVAAVLAREQIVQVWPASARLYAVAGLNVEAPGTGLILQNIRSEQRFEEATPVLRVTGQVANVSQTAREVPEIRAVSLDAQRRPIQSWKFTATPTRLLPGEVATFDTVQKEPGENVAQVTVSFDGM